MASMSGYTKLFQSILASTIWEADMPTRIVWITMLAMADKHGIVEGSVPGLATFARVSVADVRKALSVLQSPDEDSRSHEQEGRRIEPVEGGWRLINHGKYRAKLSADERREYLKLKQREYRASTKVNNVSDTDTPLTQATPKAEAESREDQDPSPTGSAFDRFWEDYPRKVAKVAALKAWKKLNPDDLLCEAIGASLAWQRQSPQWTKDKGAFVPHAATWLNQRRFEDQRPTAMEPRLRKPIADWRDECLTLHGGRCENVHFHEAMKA